MATTTTTTTIVVAIAALALALTCHGVSAQSPAPEAAMAPSPAGSDCLTALTNMSDCLTFVEDGSNLTKPDKGCCPEFAGLLDSKPICLCQLLGKSESIGIKIDLNKALKLPSACGVDTPPVSTCSAIGVPVSLPPSQSEGSPSMAPEGSATSPSNAAAVPSSGGPSPSSDEATASPSNNKNRASSIQASATNFIFGLSTLCVSSIFF